MYELQEQVKRLFIYVIARQTEFGDLEIVDKEARKFYQEYLLENEVIGEHFRITGLPPAQMKELVEMHMKERFKQGEAEIALRLQEGGDEKVRKLQRQELVEQFGLEEPVKEIPSEVLVPIMSKTEGNTLMTFQFVLSLLRAKYLENRGGTLVPADQFAKAKALNDWSFVEVPDLALRLNSRRIDDIHKSSSVYLG